MSEEDDFDDVNWEEEDEEEVMEESQTSTNLNIILNSQISKKNDSKQNKNKIKKVTFTESCYQSALRRHQADCKQLLKSATSCADWSLDDAVQCLLVSMLPESISNDGTGKRFTFATVKSICEWLHSTFKLIPNNCVTTEEGRDGSTSYDLESHVILHRAGTAHQMTQLLYSLLHALQFEVRYVVTVDPVSFAPADHSDLHRSRWEECVKSDSSTTSSSSRHTERTDDQAATASLPPPSSSAKYKERKPAKEVVPLAWVEAFLPMPRTVHASKFADLTAENSSSSSSVGATADSSSNHRSPGPSSAVVSTSRWVHLDAAHQLFDQPQAVESRLRKGQPVRYVVAVSSSSSSSTGEDCGSRLSDVTARYKHVHRHSTARDKEAAAFLAGWLRSALETVGSANNNAGEWSSDSIIHSGKPSSGGGQKQQQADVAVVDLSRDSDEEEERVQQLQQQQPIGTFSSPSSSAQLGGQQTVNSFPSSSSSSNNTGSTARARKRKAAAADREFSDDGGQQSPAASSLPGRLADFKDHPVYLLERHLLAEEALHPDAHRAGPVGTMRGEAVYLQRHKERLRSRVQWRRELRTVRADEEPVRVIKRAKMGDRDGEGGWNRGSGSSSSGEGNTIEIKLFGSWQTDALVIPPVVDGVIPVNEYGNVEVWDGQTQFVPRGAAFVEDPRAAKAARSLDLPFAPAVTGFEFRAGFTVPRIGGVVVLRAHEQVVLDAAYFLEAVREEDHYRRREKEICSRWKRLVSAVQTRQRLKDKYGH